MLDRYGFAPTDLHSQALITKSGAVLIGRQFAIDAHGERPVRVVTHAHYDHVLGLKESAERCDRIVMTPATRELVEVLYRRRIDPSKLTLCDYGKPIEFEGERLTLFDANHICGSAQVLIRSGGFELLYTGDFKLPGAPIIESDLLVIEATYGNPSCKRVFKERVEDELSRLVMARLKQGPVSIFGYHGKLQEVAHILRRAGVDEPILMPKRVYEVAKVCERYGMEIGDYLSLESPEGEECSKGRHVCLYHMRSSLTFEGTGTKIYLSGWQFDSPVRKVGKDEYEVALSDHSDFDQLLEYVESSDPEFVITDDFRVGDAKALAKEISRRLGKPALPMP